MSVQAWMRGRWRIVITYSALAGERTESFPLSSKQAAKDTYRKMTRRDGVLNVSLYLQPMDRFGNFSKEKLVDTWENMYKRTVPFDDEIPF